nr:hypothetical protein [Streptomyces xanthophaeus]
MLSRVQGALLARPGGRRKLGQPVDALPRGPGGHLKHEEEAELPLVQQVLDTYERACWGSLASWALDHPADPASDLGVIA